MTNHPCFEPLFAAIRQIRAEALEQGRRAGLEEAAQIAETFDVDDQFARLGIAEAIRQRLT